MEEISAFAAYNLNISKSKNKQKKKFGLFKSPSSKKSKEAERQALMEKIIAQHLNQKLEKSNKRKNNQFNQNKETPRSKAKKFSSSTPRDLKEKQLKITLKNEVFKEFTRQDNIEFDSFSEEKSEINFLPNNLRKIRTPSSIKKKRIIERNDATSGFVKLQIQNESFLNKSVTSVVPKNNSIKDGENVFKWLLNGIDINTFFSKYWETAPCLIQRKGETDYYSKLLSFSMINKMLLENHVEFEKNIDITKYENGVRETLNPEGRALPGVVWEKYSDGCSIRILNPQTFLSSIYSINTALQEYFHCMVGANVYLTPPNSQGFAPHYDDIEAFVIQIEGKKKWKLYNPRSKNEELPRFSSPNFQQNEIGEPILEETLEPGSILYFPRGTIHQANTVPGCHSLHITLSVYQKQSYADLLEKLFPLILEKAVQEDIETRRGLPLHIWNNMGIVHSDTQSNEREEVLKHIRGCLKRAISEISIDDAVDQLAKKFQHEALPPEIKVFEKSRTIFGGKINLNKKGEIMSTVQITLESRIRLLRAHILRLVQEEDIFRVYFYVDNSKEYKEYEPNFLEIESENAPAIEVLVKCYPDYIYTKDLPLEDDEIKLSVCQALWDRGLIMLHDE